MLRFGGVVGLAVFSVAAETVPGWVTVEDAEELPVVVVASFAPSVLDCSAPPELLIDTVGAEPVSVFDIVLVVVCVDVEGVEPVDVEVEPDGSAGEEVSDDEPASGVSASATPGLVAIATPTPSAIASPPTRPI